MKHFYLSWYLSITCLYFSSYSQDIQPFNGTSGQADGQLQLAGREAQYERGGIAGNPAVVNLVTGTGSLFRRIGLGPYSGLRLGGLYIGDGNVLLTKGLVDRRATGNSLLILSLSIDTEQFMRLPGGLFDIEFLQFNGQPTNAEAGVVQGFNNLPGLPPFNKSQIFQIWYRQTLLEEKIVVRVGKTVIPQDFCNVVRPVALRNDPLSREATSGLIYRPIFSNPVTGGFMPGIFATAAGINANYFPTKWTYGSFGFYDGSYAHDFDLALFNAPKKGPYYLTFLEIGAAWHLGKDRLPGSFGIGAFAQTGKLTVPIVRNLVPVGTVTEEGAQGFYLFGTQRLWFANPGIDESGIVGLYQFGMNNSITRPVPTYLGGAMTFFGLVPHRAQDSFGVGLALSWLNQRILPRETELMLQGYYQMNIWRTVYFVGALSYIPNPGLSANLSNVVAATARLICLF